MVDRGGQRFSARRDIAARCIVLSWVPRVPAVVRCWIWQAGYFVLLLSFAPFDGTITECNTEAGDSIESH